MDGKVYKKIIQIPRYVYGVEEYQIVFISTRWEDLKNMNEIKIHYCFLRGDPQLHRTKKDYQIDRIICHTLLIPQKTFVEFQFPAYL